MSWRVIWRLAAAGLVLAALISGGLILRQKARLGDFTRVDPHFKGACRAVPGLAGVGDMAVDRKARRVWAASSNRTGNGPAGARGAIYLMPLDGFEAASMRVDVTLGKPAIFEPRGISLWTAADGQQVLYAVNRPAGRAASVEIYDVDLSGLLVHRSTVPARAYSRLSDVVGAGPSAFYAAVESVREEGSQLEKAATLTQDGSGGLVYWVGGKFKRVASGIDYASGVALSPDGASLYAAGMLDHNLLIYDRVAATGKLSLKERVDLGSAPDKIDVAPDGGIWIAAQPKLGALRAYAMNPKAVAPSQVLLVERDASGQGGDVDQVYLSKDGALSGASVAISDGDRLLLGGAYAPNALACVLPQDFKQKTQHRFVGAQ